METLVDLDPGDDALFVQAVDHALTGADVLEESLFEEDGAGDVLAESRGGDEEFTVGLTVLDSVFEAEGFQALSAGCVGLVHREDTFASGSNLLLHSGKKGRKKKPDATFSDIEKR